LAYVPEFLKIAAGPLAVDEPPHPFVRVPVLKFGGEPVGPDSVVAAEGGEAEQGGRDPGHRSHDLTWRDQPPE